MKKWLTFDIDTFGDYDKTDSHPDDTGENIPLSSGGAMGGSIWEPEGEQETLFGGTSQRMEVLKEHIKALYHVLSENLGQTPEAFHFDDFEIRYRKLYYRDKSKSLTIRGES